MEEEPVANENIFRMNVESDIRVASGILTESDMAGFPLCGDETHHNLYVYCYAAQLLKMGNWDIATTGALVSDPESGTVNADMVVVSTASRKPGLGHTSPKDAPKWEWECKDLEANENIGVDDIRNLSQCPKKPVDLETQIKDLLAVFALSRDREITLFEIHAWIVGRCWFSIRSRFRKVSCRDPDGLNLVDRLRNWRPFDGELQSSKEFRGNWLTSVAEIFEDFGLKPTSSGTYVLNASTAVKWIGLIATIFSLLNQMFEDEEQSTSEVLDSDRVQAVTIFMRALYAIFCNEELQDLFGLESLKMITPTRVTRIIHVSNEYADEDPDDDLPTLRGDYTPVGLRKSRAGDSLFRFLRTLTVWQKSVCAIFGASSRLHVLSSLKVSWINLTTFDTLNDGSSFLRSSMRVFDKRRFDIRKREAVKAWITEQLERKRATRARIHAEAGLIALAYDVYHGRVDSHSDKSYVCALQPAGLAAAHLPIGVTRRCCLLCFHLGQLIQKEMTYTKLELPGTHGNIYPWDPPPHVPMKVLLSLHEELISEVIGYAMESKMVSASSRSPPGSSVEGLREEEDEVDIAFPDYVHKMESLL